MLYVLRFHSGLRLFSTRVRSVLAFVGGSTQPDATAPQHVREGALYIKVNFSHNPKDVEYHEVRVSYLLQTTFTLIVIRHFYTALMHICTC